MSVQQRAGDVLAAGVCSREPIRSRALGEISGSFSLPGFAEAKILLWGLGGGGGGPVPYGVTFGAKPLLADPARSGR